MKKIRVAVRQPDGAVFTWTIDLEKKPNFRSGWKIIEDDGSEKIIMDKASETILDQTPSSKREQLLIEENARLKELLAQAGLPQDVIDAPKELKPEPKLEPGESPLPGIAAEPVTDIPDDIHILPSFDSSMAEAPIEDSIQLEPEDVKPAVEVEKFSNTILSRMKNEDLIVHAHKLKPDVDLPDGAGKKVLVEIVKELQDKVLD